MTFELTHMSVSDLLTNSPTKGKSQCVCVRYTIFMCIDDRSPGCLLPLHLLSIDGQQFVQLSKELRGRGSVILLTQDEPDPLCCCGDWMGRKRARERESRWREKEREQRRAKDHMRVWGSVVKATTTKSHDWNLSHIEGPYWNFEIEGCTDCFMTDSFVTINFGQEKGQLFENTVQKVYFHFYILYLQ